MFENLPESISKYTFSIFLEYLNKTQLDFIGLSPIKSIMNI